MAPNSPTEEIASALSRLGIFAALGGPELERLARKSSVRLLGPGDRLWKMGEQATALGVVLSGKVTLARSVGTQDVILDVAIPGDVLGEVAFTLGGRYTSNVVCLRRARVALVPSGALRRRLESDARLASALALGLAAQVLRLSRHLEARASSRVDQRLARVLLDLAERVGEPFSGGVLIPVKLRRQDLAAMAATTLESASRKVSAWQKQGWVIPQPAGYLLRDLEALQKVADAP